MEVGYFRAAWNDVKNSPGWFGKVCLMALLATVSWIIPVIGPFIMGIVITGYMYGWARDIAWGVHAPMPKGLFENADGQLWQRGFFIMILSIVLGLIAGIIPNLFTMGVFSGDNTLAGVGVLLFGLASLVLTIAAQIFTWVGGLRISIYNGRLSPGFQFKKIWQMISHDSNGIVRIFLMSLLLGLLVSVIAIILAIVFFTIVGASVGGSLLASMSSASYTTSEYDWMIGLVSALFANLGLMVILALPFFFLLSVASYTTELIIIRAVGYWVRGFDVPNWGGQDAPLPFEMNPGYTAPSEQAPQNPSHTAPTEPVPADSQTTAPEATYDQTVDDAHKSSTISSSEVKTPVNDSATSQVSETVEEKPISNAVSPDWPAPNESTKTNQD